MAMWYARPHNDNTCSCLSQTGALASLIPSAPSITFPNVASLGRSLKETWGWIEKCNPCGNRRQVADLMGKCVLKLTIFSEAVCVTYNLLNIQVLHPGAGQQLVEPGGICTPSSYYASATPTLTDGRTPPPVACEKRAMRLQSYLLDDEEAELLALEIICAMVAQLYILTLTHQEWEFENKSNSFGRGCAGPVSRVSIEMIQERVGVLINSLRSNYNNQFFDDIETIQDSIIEPINLWTCFVLFEESTHQQSQGCNAAMEKEHMSIQCG